MPRTVSFALALFGAAVASQAPEYAQQYRQRLGGAIDEVRAVVSQFDSDAAAQGLDRGSAIQRLHGNADPIAQKRGDAAARSAARLDRLAHQRGSMNQAGSLGRILALAADRDPTIARNAMHDFEPAIPTTAEGAAVAGMGFLATYGLVRLIARPFRHFRRKPRAPARLRV
jgi:hypothetical protein